MKIAIVKLSAMGDIIHAMAALQFIKNHPQDIQIDWVIEKQFSPIITHHPDIHQIIPLELKRIKSQPQLFYSTVKQLRLLKQHNYDLVIDAQGLIKSALTARLIGKSILGFDKFSIREKLASYFYQHHFNYPYDANAIVRHIAILTQPLGISVNESQILNKQPYLFFQSTKIVEELLALYPLKLIFVIGSSWSAKNYPPEQFIAIAEQLKMHALVIWGNAFEKQIAEKMAEQSSWIRVLPQLDLNQLKQLIANADLVIGNDTGPTHMAWALNKASITLFGATPIRMSYQTAINRVLKSPSIVNSYRLNRQDNSIKEIPVYEIVKLAKELLQIIR
ncbi:MAG: lipopolysaccharide heptosyltransferase [Pseudomonadota bacterium]